MSDAEDIDSDDEDDDLSPSDGINPKSSGQQKQRIINGRKPSNNGPVVNKYVLTTVVGPGLTINHFYKYKTSTLTPFVKPCVI